MNRHALLLVLTAAGSGLCWWPAAIEPSVDFPRWILLLPIALITSLATVLSNGRWRCFVTVSIVGVFVGLWTAQVLFPPSNALARAYAGLVFFVVVPATSLVALLAGLVGRKLSVSSGDYRRAVWVALVCCVALGPIVLALTPPLVAHRVAIQDQIAAKRFESLKRAAERIVAEGGDPARLCDGQSLRRYYWGPPFSEEDWRRVTGNYVKQDGYFFMVYCHEKEGYTIDVLPARGKADGTRRFCTDQSGKIGCGREWNRGCVACPQ